MKKKSKGIKIDEITLDTLRISQKILDNGTFLKTHKFSDNQIEILNSFNLLTLKPFFYVCNVDENSVIEGNNFTDKVNEIALNKGVKVINISAEIESEISTINNDKDKLDFLDSMGLKEPSLSKLIRDGYNLLDLITFFTSGKKESRAWSCKKGTLAPDAGAKIHSDFKTGFIKAEVISCEEFIKYKGELNCRENGKLRLEGKDYEVVDGDVITFKFNL